MEENILNHVQKLDVEFKRYLQILRPYLSQLLDHNVFDICNAWINRLSNVNEDEKLIRNKYAFVLCYQIARGILDDPFNNDPPEGPLQPISEVPDSDSSTEMEYVVVNGEHGSSSNVLFNSKRVNSSDADFGSQTHEFNDGITGSSKDNRLSEEIISQSEATHKQTIVCYTCPKLMQACSRDVFNDSGDRYEFRANNLIKRLREIKKENMLLHNELVELKEESKINDNEFSSSFTKVKNTTNKKKLSFCADNNRTIEKSTSVTKGHDSTVSLKLIKNQLHELQENKNDLLATVANLQEQIDSFNEIKRLETEDLKAKHELEIVIIKTSLRDEFKSIYDDKLDELKDHYESIISKLNIDHDTETKVMKMELEKKVKENEKNKDQVIIEKDKELHEKDTEIAKLKYQLDEQKKNLDLLYTKFSETKANENADDTKTKAQEFERKIYKLEKSKIKCAKVYENKILYMQREKHLAECSLQLQLVKQRAQVVNEITDESQGELNSALVKLESRYKDIVAKVQSTAIQRRLQDQLALESILQAAFKPRNDYASATATNHSQASGKNVTMRQRHPNQSFDSEISGLRSKIAPIDKSFFEENAPGFCLDSDRLGELFEKVFIPQRDRAEGPLKRT